MNKERKSPFQQDDLDWLAFCYVADELDNEQRASFEERLAEDQLARDAVAGAMLLAQITCAAHEEPVSRLAYRDDSTSSWKAPFVFAASVALALLMGGWAFYANVQNQGIAQDTQDTLAVTWALASTDVESDEWPDDTQLDESEINNADWESTEEIDISEASWMTIALHEMEDPEFEDAQ